jgi:2-methylcitrate dehydratase
MPSAVNDMDSITKQLSEYACGVFCSKFTWFEIGSEPEKWDPKSRETADHSLPYIFARTLVDGPIRVSSFDDGSVRDASLRPLMAKIKIIPDETIEALSHEKTVIRVVAKTLDGATHRVEVVNPLGHPDNPMQDQHIEEKFIALVEPALGEKRCETALQRWWQVHTAEDMRALIRLLDIEPNG